jgi:hypothetical protein
LNRAIRTRGRCCCVGVGCGCGIGPSVGRGHCIRVRRPSRYSGGSAVPQASESGEVARHPLFSRFGPRARRSLVRGDAGVLCRSGRLGDSRVGARSGDCLLSAVVPPREKAGRRIIFAVGAVGPRRITSRVLRESGAAGGTQQQDQYKPCLPDRWRSSHGVSSRLVTFRDFAYNLGEADRSGSVFRRRIHRLEGGRLAGDSSAGVSVTPPQFLRSQ